MTWLADELVCVGVCAERDFSLRGITSPEPNPLFHLIGADLAGATSVFEAKELILRKLVRDLAEFFCCARAPTHTHTDIRT